jgi:hypothetical protein
MTEGRRKDDSDEIRRHVFLVFFLAATVTQSVGAEGKK